MFLLRKFGRLLRGKATPFQIIAGCLLGAWLGFLPGFADAPGLVAVAALALIVLNANLFLAGIVGVAAKLLSLALLPLSFAVGRVLLDGPTEGVFRTLLNAPVFALFGFESYVATGGLVVGGVFGLGVGLALAGALGAFRRRMAALGEDSPRLHALTQKPWARALLFLFAGGGRKQPDYAALLAQSRIGNPIRTLGAVLVLLILVLGGIGSQFLASPILTAQLRSALEEANGATVDLAGVDLDLKAGRLTLTGLAVADANALGTDLFRAERVEAAISGMNLLRKRLQLDRVEVVGATSGEARRVPGRRTRPAVKPVKPAVPPGSGSLEEYLKNAQVWRERLAQVKEWLDRASGPSAPAQGGTAASAGESLEDRLRRLAAERGYAAVKATHLIEGAPSLLIRELRAAKVTLQQLPGESLDVTARNLSTQPSLAGGAPEIAITSASDRLGFKATFSGLSAAGGDNPIAFHYRGLPVDAVAQDLKISGGTVLSGGTIDLAGRGRYLGAGGAIDLPLEATLKDTRINVGSRPTKIARFALPIGLAGSLANPTITVDAKALGNLAVQAGTEVLKEKAGEKLQEALGGRAGDFLKRLAPGKQ